MKISIVIPVYNEADYLRSCLEAISRQTFQAHEVIVVDNNSTDGSALIAESFEFVSLYNQPKQGVLHARTLGFDQATGDIIARIDADTLVDENWLESIHQIFEKEDLAAISGSALYYDIAAAPILNAIDLICLRRFLSKRLKDRCFLWGANMALKRSAWQSVRKEVCNNCGIHEDIDLGIHLQEIGLRVAFKEDLRAKVSLRRVDTSFDNFMKYLLVIPSTYADHRIIRRLYIYPVLMLCAIGYWPARVFLRGYNESSQSFNLKTLVNNTKVIDRVDPTTNIV